MSKKKERPNCLVCETQVNKTTAKFCSNKCSANYYSELNKVVKPECGYCGEEVSRSESKFCSRKCSSNNKYDRYIEKWLNGDEDGVRGTVDVSRHIKRWVIQRDGEKCCQCGWAERNPTSNTIPVRLDHIDGNWKNNRPENFRLLCPNCDSLTPTCGSLNRGRGRHKVLKERLNG